MIINTAATQKSGHLLPCGEWRDLHQPIGCVYICFQTTRPILFVVFLSLFLHSVNLHIYAWKEETSSPKRCTWSGEYRLCAMNCNHIIDLIANSGDSQLVFQKKKTSLAIYLVQSNWEWSNLPHFEINKTDFFSISKHMILVLFLAQVDIQLSCFNYWSAVGIYEIWPLHTLASGSFL